MSETDRILMNIAANIANDSNDSDHLAQFKGTPDRPGLAPGHA